MEPFVLWSRDHAHLAGVSREELEAMLEELYGPDFQLRITTAQR